MLRKETYFFFVITFLISCNSQPTEPENKNIVTDIDGNTYKTIQIGEQLWMAENLRVEHYLNDDIIQKVTDGDKWIQLKEGACASYANEDSSVSKYGLLYNFYAVEDPRGLAPRGWHVPTDEDWKKLEIYVGMSKSSVDSTGRRGQEVGGKLKDVDSGFWHSPNTGATNESRFSALPGGYRYGRHGSFFYEGLRAYFWSSTESSDSSFEFFRLLEYSLSTVDRNGYNKYFGLSVRCIKN